MLFHARSMTIFDTAAIASFPLTKRRIRRSVCRNSGNSLAEAYQRDRHSLLSASRNPIGLTFCPILILSLGPIVYSLPWRPVLREQRPSVLPRRRLALYVWRSALCVFVSWSYPASFSVSLRPQTLSLYVSSSSFAENRRSEQCEYDWSASESGLRHLGHERGTA